MRTIRRYTSEMDDWSGVQIVDKLRRTSGCVSAAAIDSTMARLKGAANVFADVCKPAILH